MPETASIRCADLLFDEGILHIYFNESEITKSDVQEIYMKGIELAGGQPHCSLAYLLNNPPSEPEVRAFAADAHYQFRLADALLTDSLSMKLVANSYIKFNKPQVPTKMFTDKAEAVRWLRTFLDR